jgi:hypothetical protein
MEQHPVPQQISSYHFRLIGEMTIKQFLELLAGVVLAWLIYSIEIPSLFKWPLILASVFTGVAFAFLPLEERPLDKWLFAFIKASYSPTKFLWKKKSAVPGFLEERPKRKITEEPREQADRKKLKEYLESLPVQTTLTSLDSQESHFISNIMNVYYEVQPTTATQVKPPKPSQVESTQEPEVKIKVRKLKTPPINPKAIMRGEVIMPKRSKSTEKSFHIPSEPTPLFNLTQPKTQLISELTRVTESEIPAPAQIGLENISLINKEKPIQHTQAPFVSLSNSNIPIPTTPTTPNVIVGMVVDTNGSIVENAIITIKDERGNIERAQKTNKIGQFFIATPLKNGIYEIEVEKTGLSFAIMKINLEGKPIPPIQIQSN